MSAMSYADLRTHLGHRIECVGYGDAGNPQNVSVECVDCYEVLLDFDCDDEPRKEEMGTT